MSTAKQLLALGQKDLYIAKRSKCRCCCELFVPLFMLPFIVVILVASSRFGDGTRTRTFDTKAVGSDIRNNMGEFKILIEDDYDYEKFHKSAELLGVTFGDRGSIRDIVSGDYVRFEAFETDTPRFKYIISSHTQDYSSEWTDPYDSPPFSVSIQPFLNEFILQNQHTVDSVILNMIKNDTSTYRTKQPAVQPLPHPKYKENWANNFILPYLPILITMCLLIPISNAAKDVIVEVESEIKVYMMVLGMTRLSFYFSHFLNSCIKVLIIVFIFIFPFVFYLNAGTSFAMYGLVLLFTICMVTYALFWATILHRPGLCIAIIILTSMLFAVLTFVAPNNRMDVGLMCACALNPVQAFDMAFKDLRFYDRYGKFPWPGSRIGYQFNIFLSAIFLIIDTLVLIAATFLLDFILPSAGQSGVNFMALFKRSNRVQDLEANDIEKGDFEASIKKSYKAGIKVSDLKKKWDFTGEYAVNGVSFTAHNDEITCLLGHNGAGKTTTFSCLTGYTKPTSGELLICGLDIRNQLTKCRKLIGYCPQTNPLFDRLTCAEHLRLAARLRGSYKGEEDIREVLVEVGLGHAVNMLSSQLSGGMKRKLCVALALVGQSKIVLLDEPTAGMDPTARRQIGSILDKFKKDRAIILTTHYMDEADSLADKIVILAKGQVVATGSSAFLKKRFGTGFLLTITMNVGVNNVEENAQTILERIRDHISEAQFDGSPALQFVVNLPHESKTKFTQVFSMLEDESDELNIDSFGLSVNTLEQVFIRVGEKAEGASSQELRKKIIANAETIQRGDEARSPNVLKKFQALWIRNLTYWIRNPFRTLVPLVIVFICFVFLYAFHQDSEDLRKDFSTSTYSSKVLPQPLSDLPKSEILVGKSMFDSVQRLLKPLKQCKVVQIDDNTGTSDTSHTFDVPAPSLGLVSTPSKTTLMGNRFLETGYILVMNLYSNLQLGALYDSIIIELDIRGHKFDFNLVRTLLSSSFIEALCIVGGVTYGMAMLLSEVITERVRRFKNQLYLAGCNGPLYWLAQLSSDFLYYLILVVIVMCGSAWVSNLKFVCAFGAWPVWMMYFVTASLASYVLSFLFSSPTKGIVFVLAFHTIIPLILQMLVMIVVFIMYYVLFQEVAKQQSDDSFDTLENITNYVTLIIGFFFPGLDLFVAQNYVINVCSDATSTYSSPFEQDPSPIKAQITQKAAEYKMLNVAPIQSMISLVVGFLFYGTFLILLELKILGRQKNIKMTTWPTQAVDEDVTHEANRIAKISDHELSLAVRNLYKFYNKSKCALENLSFGINHNECFGLLGINGAGKTTCFDILSNVIRPSGGTASINGIGVKHNPIIGYCPQFDALSEVLSANDTLNLIGRLMGFENVAERVQLVLECVMMEEHAKKIVKKCSGGQKRRVSIAVALMNGANFLMLDEPTAGVDPGTRRQLWDLLIAMRKLNKSILLTTHSMEECETLCNRIGFLRDGRLQGIGTSQHLKSRYGNSYLLTLVQTNPLDGHGHVLDAAVQAQFGAGPTQESYLLTALTWDIPRRAEFSWSQMYEKIESFVNELNQNHNNAVRDFYLIQNSLEQVFTRLAANVEESIGHAPPPYQMAVENGHPIQLSNGHAVTTPPTTPPPATVNIVNTNPWNTSL